MLKPGIALLASRLTQKPGYRFFLATEVLWCREHCCAIHVRASPANDSSNRRVAHARGTGAPPALLLPELDKLRALRGARGRPEVQRDHLAGFGPGGHYKRQTPVSRSVRFNKNN